MIGGRACPLVSMEKIESEREKEKERERERERESERSETQFNYIESLKRNQWKREKF